jgi:hypothetical protein
MSYSYRNESRPLTRDVRVVPVLVDGARTPKADRLRDSVKPLVRRNAVEVRNTHFGREKKRKAPGYRPRRRGDRIA